MNKAFLTVATAVAMCAIIRSNYFIFKLFQLPVT
jgi:hypothetical protein